MRTRTGLPATRIWSSCGDALADVCGLAVHRDLAVGNHLLHVAPRADAGLRQHLVQLGRVGRRGAAPAWRPRLRARAPARCRRHPDTTSENRSLASTGVHAGAASAGAAAVGAAPSADSSSSSSGSSQRSVTSSAGAPAWPPSGRSPLRLRRPRRRLRLRRRCASSRGSPAPRRVRHGARHRPPETAPRLRAQARRGRGLLGRGRRVRISIGWIHGCGEGAVCAAASVGSLSAAADRRGAVRARSRARPTQGRRRRQAPRSARAEAVRRQRFAARRRARAHPGHRPGGPAVAHRVRRRARCPAGAADRAAPSRGRRGTAASCAYSAGRPGASRCRSTSIQPRSSSCLTIGALTVTPRMSSMSPRVTGCR